jgi:hypothetical protein
MTTQNPSLEMINEEIADDLIEQTSSYREIVETTISSLDNENTAMVSHQDSGFLWKFQYGTVEVFVQLTGESDDDLFKVWSSVLKLPAKDEPGLMRKLLEMNWSHTFETCFALLDDRIVVSVERTVAELSPGEIARAITLVASIADENDEKLKADFGGV